MNPWLESLGVALLAFGGFLAGRWFSRLPKPWWMFGYFIPLAFVIARALALRIPSLAFMPPLSWIMMGRIKYAIVGVVATMILTTPLSRLSSKRDRAMICLLMAVMVFASSVWPSLAPAFNRTLLASLTTKIDRDGVCLQSTDYNCGPAAAVTALRKLGLPAEEGRIAILAHTCSAAGTEPDILAEVLQKEYRAEGLTAEYRNFKNLDELKSAGITLAVIKFGFLVDHYVTVLQVTDNGVVIGDPLGGLDTLSPAQFQARWRFTGVSLKRDITPLYRKP